jgi:hypothetical protein
MLTALASSGRHCKPAFGQVPQAVCGAALGAEPIAIESPLPRQIAKHGEVFDRISHRCRSVPFSWPGRPTTHRRTESRDSRSASFVFVVCLAAPAQKRISKLAAGMRRLGIKWIISV